MAKIVLFDSIKGGVGKSTLAAQFVVYLIKKGKSVAIFDSDSQKSMEYWALRRNMSNKGLETVSVIDASDVNNINSSKNKFDFIIADSVGADSKIGRYLLSITDIVVSPLNAKQSSIDTVAKHNKVLNEALGIRTTPFQSFYLLNMCSTNRFDTKRKDAFNFLNDKKREGKICSEVIQTAIYHREILDTTFGNGETCFDTIRSNKSKNELSLVIGKILGV